MNLSRFFTLDELTWSQTARAEGIDNQPGENELAALRALCGDVLDPLRAALGQPIKVTSGYRGPALNRRIKGAASSQHLSGQAADVQAPGTSVLSLFQLMIRLLLPFDQIIYEVKGTSKWVHVSHRPGANRGQILLAKFSPDGRVSYPVLTAQQALEMTEPVSRSRRGAAEPGYVETADEPAHDHPAADALVTAPESASASASASASGSAPEAVTTRARTASRGGSRPASAKRAAAAPDTSSPRRAAKPAAAPPKAAAKRTRPAAKAAKPAAPAPRSRRGG